MKRRLGKGMSTFWIFEVEDGVVVSKEVDLIDAERVSSDFLDDVLDVLIVAALD